MGGDALSRSRQGPASNRGNAHAIASCTTQCFDTCVPCWTCQQPAVWSSLCSTTHGQLNKLNKINCIGVETVFHQPLGMEAAFETIINHLMMV